MAESGVGVGFGDFETATEPPEGGRVGGGLRHWHSPRRPCNLLPSNIIQLLETLFHFLY